MGTTKTMKKNQTVIPLKLREEMALDPFYKHCALFGQVIEGKHPHICEGKITWEHAMIYAGEKIQKKWAIIPLCEKAHAVNSFQDAGTMKKEVNRWVALNRASRPDLEAYTLPDVKFNKVDYFRELTCLNAKYGLYIRKEPQPIKSPIGVEIKQKFTMVIEGKLAEDIWRAMDILKDRGVDYKGNPGQFILETLVNCIREIEKLPAIPVDKNQ